MLDIRSLSVEEKRQLIRFLWEIKLKGTGEGVPPDRQAELIMLVEDVLQISVEVSENVFDRVLKMLMPYIPELRADNEHRYDLFEREFRKFQKNPELFLARDNYRRGVGEGEILQLGKK